MTEEKRCYNCKFIDRCLDCSGRAPYCPCAVCYDAYLRMGAKPHWQPREEKQSVEEFRKNIILDRVKGGLH